MQGIYYLQQGKNERVVAFTTWLEGALSDILTKHPHHVTGHEAKGHLHDMIIPQIMYTIVSSLQYLFHNPQPELLTLDGSCLEIRDGAGSK